MKKFQRRFDVRSLDEHIGKDKSLIGALFGRWALPGQQSGNDAALRLAVRDGYLNFYANGQSVAKVTAPNGEARVEVHWKYVEGIPNGQRAEWTGKEYRKFAGTELLVGSSDVIDRWIATAKTYAGDEKRFVEHLVARNPNAIDLEMGLPGDPSFQSSRPERKGKTGLFAPRMDLVLVQPGTQYGLIEFWEAKLATNGELRARSLPENPDHKPHVIYQLDDYTRWVENRTEEVARAYEAAVVVLDNVAGKLGKRGEAREIWADVISKGLKVKPRPGIIIADYDPNGLTDHQSRRAESFATHLGTLKANDCLVRQVSGRDCELARLWSGHGGATA